MIWCGLDWFQVHIRSSNPTHSVSNGTHWQSHWCLVQSWHSGQNAFFWTIKISYKLASLPTVNRIAMFAGPCCKHVIVRIRFFLRRPSWTPTASTYVFAVRHAVLSIWTRRTRLTHVVVAIITAVGVLALTSTLAQITLEYFVKTYLLCLKTD